MPPTHDIRRSMVSRPPGQRHSVREPAHASQEALSVLWRSRHARRYDVLYLRESLKGVTTIDGLCLLDIDWGQFLLALY
jgi:hypothetical protein